MFWGLRECRRINLQLIQQAELTIECAGARITRTINDVQHYPNFQSSAEEADKYKLFVVGKTKLVHSIYASIGVVF